MSIPTFFQDDVAATVRAVEVAGASFDNGMNLGGSNAPGIGINMLKGAIVGTPEQFTLLDQGTQANDFTPEVRAPQISQSIGGFPYVDRSTVPWPGSGGTPGVAPEGSIRYGDNELPTYDQIVANGELSGTITPIANATLNTLALGWVAG